MNLASSPSPSAPVLDEAERAALQRRTMSTLRVSQVPGQIAVAGSVAVVSLLASELLGSDRWAGIGGAAFTVGAAVTAVPLAATMRRRGRRPGLIMAFLIAAFGSMIAAVGGQTGWFWLFVIGLALFGAGQAGTLQGRYVATDLVEPERRASAVASIVWVGTIGAVLGPVVTPIGKSTAASLGLEELVGPYLFGVVLFSMSALVVFLRLRPDPLVVVGGTDPHAERARPLRAVRVSYGEIRRSRRAVLGLASMAGSQAAMVAVMTMTPPHMKDHGHADLSALVIAVHIIGMFGLAPVVGRFVARVGEIRAVQWGAVVLGSGTLASVIAGYVPAMMFIGLFLLGLGWNVGLIAGTTLLTSSVPEPARVAAQGTGDLTMSLCGAGAALASGFVKDSLGFHLLADAATALAAVLLVTAWFVQARERAERRAISAGASTARSGDASRHP